MATSTVSYAEARAALARKARDGGLDPEGHRRAVDALNAGWEMYDRVPATDTRGAGVLAERYALRSFDAIHLASAMTMNELSSREELRFLAFDDALNAAAGQAVTVYESEGD